MLIFGGNIPDSIRNNTICNMWGRCSLSIATSNFKMRLNIFPFQRCNNWNIANHTGFGMAIKLLLSHFASNYLHDRSLLISRRSGIILFNSRGTCACCLDSRQCFNVKRGFHWRRSNSDRKLYICNGYGAKKLIKEFPDKGWALSSLNKLLNYLNILPVCFASFFLALRDVIA